MAYNYMPAIFVACAFLAVATWVIPRFLFPDELGSHSFSRYAVLVLFACVATWLPAQWCRSRGTTAVAHRQNPSERETLLPITKPGSSGTTIVQDDETISDNATMRARCGSPPRQRFPGLAHSTVPPDTRDTDDVMAGVDGERHMSCGQPLPRSGSPDILEGTTPSIGRKWPQVVKDKILDGRLEAAVPRDPNRYW